MIAGYQIESQIMLELGAIVQGPALLNILSGEAQPRDAYVAIQYGGRWFWIANTDIRSKYTFGMVMLLFSISETGVRGNAPVVTVPAN